LCGICGFTGKTDQKSLQRLTDALTHRGPDDYGYYCDGMINLGMRRLSIVDLDTGKQPQFNEDKRLVVIFNGEIYNYQTLRDELEKTGINSGRTIVMGLH
jgi:asparagine synthase (glutamine-hydrolysing)